MGVEATRTGCTPVRRGEGREGDEWGNSPPDALFSRIFVACTAGSFEGRSGLPSSVQYGVRRK